VAAEQNPFHLAQLMLEWRTALCDEPINNLDIALEMLK